MTRTMVQAARHTILLTSLVSKTEIVRFLKVGVSGVVFKQSPSELLHKSIRAVFGGELWLSRDMVKDIAKGPRRGRGRR